MASVYLPYMAGARGTFLIWQVRGGRLRVNGVPVTLRGVNRHEHDATTGHVVNRASMEADIRLMKVMDYHRDHDLHKSI